MPKVKFPSIKAVAKALADLKQDVDSGSDMDVRLQVYEDGRWAVRYGDSSYDLDHRGYWGSSSIDKRTNSRDLAKTLIKDARDHHAQCE